jgi:hypothetical protein
MPVKTNNNNNLQGVISEKMNDTFKRFMTRRRVAADLLRKRFRLHINFALPSFAD